MRIHSVEGNIMLPDYDENAIKKASNLSINSDLLRQAKAFNINLSATLEAALKTKLSEILTQQWLEENRESIATYNESVLEQGVFSDGIRSF
jgi:antitoxin CcdA